VLRRRVRGLRDAIEAARGLLAHGPSLVILSLGADGALLATSRPRGMWMAQPPRVVAESSVGAGDSLMGGFLTGWARGQSMTEAFRLGVACGTATAMTPGTALCRREDVHRLLRRVTLRRLE
jgi:6-phosphofructokinase 2